MRPSAAAHPAGTRRGRLPDAVRWLWRVDPWLTGAGLLCLVMTGPLLAAMWMDPRAIAGAPAWLKPAKFAVSIGLYTLTFAWFLSFLPPGSRARRAAGRATALLLLGELFVIGLQAWRGTASHFNVATPLDAMLFTLMGAGILLQTLISLGVAIALWRQPFADRALGWAIRAGLAITIAGAFMGGLMTRPTGSQLAEARATGRMAVAGAHTVGAPDGGPGLPGTGWSTEHGDLRAPHFLGLHAMQALPLLALAVRRRQERTRTRVVLGGTVVYAAVFAGLLVQALQGRPLIPLGADAAISAADLFAAANVLALLAWLLLALTPARAGMARTIATRVVPTMLAAAYAVLIAAQWGSPGGFGSLDDVSRLFENRWLLLAGWVHYLAFDLLVGAWEVGDAEARGISRGFVIPCLLLTFMFGPAGWLLYRTIAAVHGDRRAGDARASGAVPAS
ncbi:MAG: ABA4-like family protein [Vicinamibacterales bacterium]